SRPQPAAPVPASEGRQPGHALRALRDDGALAPRASLTTESIMTLKIYAVVLELVRKLSP
ncbi:MAG: hypothetical protein ABI895_28910, partial [Deltaproteobacteria bacterium]